MATVATIMYSDHHHSFSQANSAATYTLTQEQHPQEQEEESFMEDEQTTTSFCRALYDYEAQNDSSLSFSRGEIIEVLSKQPSGWWDGLLGDSRGWFPSNYVEHISDEEAERAFSAESFGAESLVPHPSESNSSNTVVHGTGQVSDEEWLEGEVSPARNGASQSSDFWEPKVADNNQIYYVNTQTGQRSRDIPKEVDDEISDTEFAGLTSQISSRSGTSASLAFGLNGSITESMNMVDIAGFGIPRRTGTPEPWVKKLADDGRSYYWLNKVDGRIVWSPPEAPPRSSSQSSSSPPRSKALNDNNRLSAYSDDSDVQPFIEPLRRGPDTLLPKPLPQPYARPTTKTAPPDYTTAERIARSLQQAIAPPPPEPVTELTAATKSAIQAVINNVQMNGLARRPEEDEKFHKLIYNVILMVRNLVYILAVPILQIPANVLPRDADFPPSSSQSPLKPAQRKLTATLSRLILASRDIHYDTPSVLADTLGRVEIDAEALENAVSSFVLQVHRLEHSSALPRPKQPKRLHGVFSTVNVGPGLVGAGAGGRWKGLGWVPLDDDQVSPPRVLGPEVLSEVKQYSNNLDVQFQYLMHALQATDQNSVKQVQSSGRELVSQISAMLTCVSDIHIARHIDVDGFQQEGSSSNGPYGKTVETARILVRTLETIIQAIHNDTAVFFLTLQSVRDADGLIYWQERDYAWDHLDALSSSLSANIAAMLEALDALLALGHEQYEMASGDYNGSIEWRMSRLSARPISNYTDEDEDGPDVIDMEMAFGRAPSRSQVVATQPLYKRPHTSSDASNTLVSSSFDFDSATNTLVPEEEQELDATLDTKEKQIDEDPALGPKSTPQPSGSRKLRQVLGAEYVSKVAADLKPWYLRVDYTAEEILIDPDNTVKGGTLPALVERLTAHEQVDPSFNQAFLMTFKSFTTVDELFDLLVARFRIEPPMDLKPNELEEWGKQKKHLVQIRVINTFVTMLKDEDILEKEDYHILERMKTFVSSDEVSQFGAAKQVLVYIDRAIRNDNNALKAMPQSTPPPPILPKVGKKLKLADIDPLELARQLTIMESNLYQKIKPMECLQRAREQKTENIDNIAIVIQTSNRIADWVAESVLSKEDSRKRAAAVKNLISVADRCRALNNFSSMIAITSGLNTPPIRRLKRTWEQVNQRSMAQFGACETTIDSNKNFTKYRQLMASVTPPCVPFIGVFLSTLQFIQDGNPDMLPGGLVNFRKRQKASEVINDIKRWQAQPFNLQTIPSVQTYIEEALNQFNDTKASSEYFWALSLEREPREREDEKMARLLQESGFL